MASNKPSSPQRRATCKMKHSQAVNAPEQAADPRGAEPRPDHEEASPHLCSRGRDRLPTPQSSPCLASAALSTTPEGTSHVQAATRAWSATYELSCVARHSAPGRAKKIQHVPKKKLKPNTVSSDSKQMSRSLCLRRSASQEAAEGRAGARGIGSGKKSPNLRAGFCGCAGGSATSRNLPQREACLTSRRGHPSFGSGATPVSTRSEVLLLRVAAGASAIVATIFKLRALSPLGSAGTTSAKLSVIGASAPRRLACPLRTLAHERSHLFGAEAPTPARAATRMLEANACLRPFS